MIFHIFWLNTGIILYPYFNKSTTFPDHLIMCKNLFWFVCFLSFWNHQTLLEEVDVVRLWNMIHVSRWLLIFRVCCRNFRKKKKKKKPIPRLVISRYPMLRPGQEKFCKKNLHSKSCDSKTLYLGERSKDGPFYWKALPWENITSAR